MLKKLSIILSALLISSCSGGSAFNRRAAEQEWGIAQYQTDGDRKIFQVCAVCPAPTRKTSWDGLQVASLDTDSLEAAGDISRKDLNAGGPVEVRAAESNSMDQSSVILDEASVGLNTVESDAQQVESTVIIHFEFDSYKISEDQHPKLDSLAHQLGKEVESTVSITGYTDDVGRKKYNDRLAKARASEIARYLIDHGKVRKERIQVTGDGKCCYVASNATDSGRAMNRRAVAIVNIELLSSSKEEIQK
jgi:outer membrane protein OmpA-like peptidoglycan-associated protein